MKLSILTSLLFAATAYSRGSQIACPSGQLAVSDSCSPADINGCPTFQTSAPLMTSSIAELILERSKIEGNNVTLFIQSEPRVGRIMTGIALQDQNQEDCLYPGPYFEKGFENCFDTYIGFFEFQQVVACGFVNQNNGTHDVYTGFVKVTTEDDVGVLRESAVTRTTDAMLEVSLTLPKSISLSVNDVNVISLIAVEAAVVGQSYDASIDVATISLLTSVQFPYLLTSATIDVTSIAEFGTEISSLPFNCTANEPCEREYSISISGAATGGCTFDGSYLVTFQYTCFPEYPNCPVQAGLTVQVSFSLVSGDICSKLTVSSRLEGSMASYSDEAFKTQRITFVGNQNAYFLVSIDSGVDIQSIQLKDLVFGEFLAISNGSPNDALPINLDFSVIPISNNKIGVRLLLEVGPEKLFDGSADQIFQIDVSAIVTVNYRTTFNRKREVISQNLAMKQTIVIDLTQFKSVDTDSASYAAPLFIAAAGALALNF